MTAILREVYGAQHIGYFAAVMQRFGVIVMQIRIGGTT
jgi:hypothetical protein